MEIQINALISLILGLSLASLFNQVCKDGNCVIVKARPLDQVENKIYKKHNKCYRLQPTKC